MPHDEDKAHRKGAGSGNHRTEAVGKGLGELLGQPEETESRGDRQERADGEAGDAVSPNEGAQEDARNE